mgnify:CR=1 FL=1
MTHPKIKTVIIDDDPVALDKIETLVQPYPDIKMIDKISEPEQAIGVISKYTPDFLLLDIHMPRMDGFQLIEAIRPLNVNPSVIFLTSHDRSPIQTIRFVSLDFLVKPVSRNEMENAIQRVKHHVNEHNASQIQELMNQWNARKKLKFKTHHGTIFINQHDILYLQARGNYSAIYMNEMNYEVVSINLGKLEEELQQPPFFRISRSAIINTTYLHKIDKKNRECQLLKDRDTITLAMSKEKIKILESLI